MQRSADQASARGDAATRRSFFYLLLITLAFRFWLAAVTPFTGDEASFYLWGKWPDWGFYDHPPMVGWWLAVLQRVSTQEWVLRLPSVVQPAVLALCSALVLRREAEPDWLAATLVLLVPAHLWNIAITTDTPLVYFSFFSGLAFLRAVRDGHPGFYLLSGVLLGAAFLSKYFAVLLGLAYLCHTLIRPARAKWLGLLLVVAGSAPAVALNLWWNSNHCWANLMFNLYNRHGGAGLSWRTPLLYVVMLMYLVTPPLLLTLWRRRHVIGRQWHEPAQRALLLIALAPLALFAALALVRRVGLHWVLAFIPFLVLLVARVADAPLLSQARRFLIGFAAAHVVVFAAVSQLPLDTWRDFALTRRHYDGLVMMVKAEEVLAPLAPYAADYVFAATGYSAAAIMSFNAGRYFSIFGEGSSYSRQDDILTDFRALHGRNILVWRNQAPSIADYKPYFREVEQRSYSVRGADYYLLLGRGFDYPTYRERVLARVRARYYAIPAYLPLRGCYFCERYFPDIPSR